MLLKVVINVNLNACIAVIINLFSGEMHIHLHIIICAFILETRIDKLIVLLQEVSCFGGE